MIGQLQYARSSNDVVQLTFCYWTYLSSFVCFPSSGKDNPIQEFLCNWSLFTSLCGEVIGKLEDPVANITEVLCTGASQTIPKHLQTQKTDLNHGIMMMIVKVLVLNKCRPSILPTSTF